MAYAYEIDPTSEDATNVPLALTTSPYGIVGEELTMPPVNARFAEQEQADGARLNGLSHGNRQLVLTIEMKGTTAAALENALGDLAAKVGKLNREGGTLKRTSPSGDSVVYDVLTASELQPTVDIAYTEGNYTQTQVKFTCRPFGRGAEVSYSLRSETSLPVLVFTETAVPGDVPALGRLEVTDAQGADQVWATWGVRSRNYSSATSAGLFYEAEGRTALGTAAVATVSGASGGGSNNAVQDSTLSTTWRPILSTQAASAGAHLSHVGTYRVYARLYRPATPTGDVQVRFVWSTGDFRDVTTNSSVCSFDGLYLAQAGFVVHNFGLVRLPEVVRGTQRWEGRFEAKSSVAGDDVAIDCFWLVPADEASGEAQASTQVEALSYTARDEFGTANASLTALTLPIGGDWDGAGDTDDFSVSGGQAYRDDQSDTGTGRYAYATGTSGMTNTVVEVDVTIDPTGALNTLFAGLLARYTDTSNHVQVFVRNSAGDTLVGIQKTVAGTITALGDYETTITDGVTYTLRAHIDAAGRYRVWLAQEGLALGDPVLVGQDDALATGGTLASGYCGLWDQANTANEGTRYYDNFSAFVPAGDAVAFASQTAEWRYDGVIREDSSGAIWGDVSRYEGDLCLIPPAGPEARTCEVIVKASRAIPGTGPDKAIDDLSARLYVTPRYLLVS